MSFNNFMLPLLFISPLLFPYVSSLIFNFSSFDEGSTSLIDQQGDAFINGGRIKLTENKEGSAKAGSTGRAIYKEEIVVWDEKTRELTDFTTHFSFIINCSKGSYCGDGMTFFLAKKTAAIPDGSGGGRLALYGSKTDFNKKENGFVAVEFDSFKNIQYDPSEDHLGIDIDSIVSVANVSLTSSIKDGRTGNARVTYNSSTHNISVFLTYAKNPIYRAKPTLSYNVDLRDVLPSRVAVGFSAATGLAAETHEIMSWSFSSRLEEKPEVPKNQTVPKRPKNPHVNSLVFNISSFDEGSTSLIDQQGDAFIKDGRIKLTENKEGVAKLDSTGRAIYKEEIVLWDEKTGELTDFTTHFSFIIKCLEGSYCGDGMTFFLAKRTAAIPEGSGGALLALYGSKTEFNNTEHGFVAVEFDSFKNNFDPSEDHLGIDINSIVSVANVSLNSSIKDGRTGNAWVTYDSSTHNISVFLTYAKNPIYKAKPTLSYNVDLRKVLPSKVAVGFSASTGNAAETHEIISWSFSSRLEGKTEVPKHQTAPESPKKAESPIIAQSPIKAESPTKASEKAEAPEKPKIPDAAKSPEISEHPDHTKKPENGDKLENSENKNKSNVGLIIGLTVSIGAILFL